MWGRVGDPSFVGRFRELAVDIATRAIQCASKELSFAVEKHPLYFMSDESELVNYLAFNLTNSNYVTKHSNWLQGGSNGTALHVVTKFNVVARDQSIINAHIDKNKGRPSEAYYATFVDLYLGMNARCISYGIGYYALFAAKISGTKCLIRYSKELWGEKETKSSSLAPMCKLV